MRLIWIIFLILSLYSCQSEVEPNKKEPTPPLPSDPLVSEYDAFPYTLNAPTKSFTLDAKLKEISGLSWHTKETFLLANNDEEGIIYFLDPQTAEIKKEWSFEDKGDFEGIEMVGEQIFLTKSNGTIYEVNGDNERIRYKTILKKKFDVEGLAYNRLKHVLLLICKGTAVSKKEKTIYAFDLNNKSLIPQPILSIQRKTIQQFLIQNTMLTNEAAEELSKEFAPSAIAEHPQTGDLYVLSATANLLLVLSPSGQTLHVERLDRELFPQPEGLCFNPQTLDLYISTEGKKGDGMLHYFQH